MNLSPDMAQAFAIARPHAQHCGDLIKSGPRPEERAENLAVWRRDIGRELSQDLSELLSGARLAVTLSEPEMIPGSEVFSRIGPVAANCLLRCGKDDHTLLLSFNLKTALAMTDRSFGGDGRIEDNEVPEQLPRSAAMLTDSAAKIVAQAIARTSFGSEHASFDGTERSLKADVIVRSESATRLKPFAHEAMCAVFLLDCCEEEGVGEPVSWKAILAVTTERFEQLIPGAGSASSEQSDDADAGEPASGPFADIPMELGAVLAEFEMSLSQLERMAPGDKIPLFVPREIPLLMGEEVLAQGTVGTRDEKLAVKLTRFENSEVAA
ncbi:MAG: FliM/FliN family flagellar motor switch protein [Pseudomonadota bacterium]